MQSRATTMRGQTRVIARNSEERKVISSVGRSSANHTHFLHSPYEHLLSVQRTIGNQATLRRLQDDGADNTSGPSSPPTAPAGLSSQPVSVDRIEIVNGP